MTEAISKAILMKSKNMLTTLKRALTIHGAQKSPVLQDNAYNFKMCKRHGCNCILIDGSYHVDIEL